MDVRPIRNEADYDWALAQIAPYFEHEPEAGTDDAARFDVLAALIENYEATAWRIEATDPVEAIRYRMETGGLRQADLARVLGSRSRASEILARKRPLTIDMVWKLHHEWKIPAEALITPYRTGA